MTNNSNQKSKQANKTQEYKRNKRNKVHRRRESQEQQEKEIDAHAIFRQGFGEEEERSRRKEEICPLGGAK